MEITTLIIGGLIGTTLSVTLFANAPKLGIVEGWHFFMDGQAQLMRTQNKFLIYFPRFILGGLILPLVYLYIWGVDGLLGISLFNSHILSSIGLALVEAPLMVLGIYSGIMKQPNGTTTGLIIMAIIGHINLGFWIGLFATF